MKPVARHLIAALATIASGLLISLAVLYATAIPLDTPDGTGWMIGAGTLAALASLILYAPTAALLQSRTQMRGSRKAIALAPLANLPLFITLFALDRAGGFFGQGEAMLLGGLSVVLAVVYGTTLMRVSASKRNG